MMIKTITFSYYVGIQHSNFQDHKNLSNFRFYGFCRFSLILSNSAGDANIDYRDVDGRKEKEINTLGVHFFFKAPVRASKDSNVCWLVGLSVCWSACGKNQISISYQWELFR